MSKQAAAFIANTTLETLPPDVVRTAKLHILDTIGSGLAGYPLKATQLAARFAERLGGAQEATVWASGARVSVPAAAFANCVAADALDYEDGHMGCGAHPGSVAVPPTLAVAEWQNSSGVEFLEAVVVAYEVGLRAGTMLARLQAHAPIATGTMGSITSAAGAAKLMKLDQEQAAQALALATTHRPALSGATGSRMGSMLKAGIAWSGLIGVASAIQAQLGFTGGGTPFNLRFDGTEPHPYLPFDGKTWESLKTYYKAYPSCRYTHAPLDATFRLVRENKLKPDDIALITVETAMNPSTLNSVAPKTVERAQFSIPFVLGAGLAYGRVTPDEIAEEHLNDSKILAQARKVHVQVSGEMEELFPRRYPAVVHIETRDGKQLVARQETATGDFDDPMTEEQIRAKFVAAATRAVGQAKAQKLVSLVENLEQVRSVREVVGLLGVGAAVR
ncbi:MAG: MmgE/PrpD family protein [Chloroflexi bacterium]|nr:MmgE/PrpD family protein [Chloroflexota bacterium]